MATLILSQPTVPGGATPLTVDLSTYLDVQKGDGMDPANPSYSEKVFAHSLLKEGGALALEDLKNREMVFPLFIGAGGQSASVEVVQLINQIVNTPGAVCEWQDGGVTQATFFDLVGGQFDIEYDFRRENAPSGTITGKLRLFALPFGRKSAPRSYAVATGAGPMLLVSTPSAITSFGGTSLFGVTTFTGATALDGDAAAQLGASWNLNLASSGTTDIVAMSVLPDESYLPLVAVKNVPAGSVFGATGLYPASGYAFVAGASGAVAGGYVGATRSAAARLLPPWTPIWTAGATVIPPAYDGQHRALAIARNVGGSSNGSLRLMPLYGAPFGATVGVPSGDWQLVDLGVVGVAQGQSIESIGYFELSMFPGAGGTLEVTAVAFLPEASTVFWNPAVGPLSYQPSPGATFDGTRPGVGGVLDTVLADASQYARGKVPQADPKMGTPAIALFAMPYATSVATALPLNFSTFATVSVLERDRYIFE